MIVWLNSEWLHLLNSEWLHDWIVNDRMVAWLNSEWSNDYMIE